MHRSLRGRLLAAALLLGTAPFIAAVPAYAQVSVDISFDSFHDQLSRYGAWVYSDRWGTVWQPGDVPDDFRPYASGGHWEYTDDYGWTWVSDYAWGDIAFHYGRWVYDPDDGWLWMPGYVWSPAWVVWRGNDNYLGWMPMPPDDNFLYGRADIGVSSRWDDPDRYYSDWYGPRFSGPSLWVFIGYGHIGDRDYHRYWVPPSRTTVLIHQTTNITNYTVVNNYVVNNSINVHRVEQFAGHPIRPVPARQVMRHPDLIATVAHGDAVRAQMLRVAPRGLGRPGSAPPPPPAIINKLSDHAVMRGRGEPQHLFTRAALQQPEAAQHFHGKPVENGPGPAPHHDFRDSRPQREMDIQGPRTPRPTTPPDTEPSNVPHRERDVHGPSRVPPPPDTEPPGVPRDRTTEPPDWHQRDNRSFAPGDRIPTNRPENPPSNSWNRPNNSWNPPNNGWHSNDPRGPEPHAMNAHPPEMHQQEARPHQQEMRPQEMHPQERHAPPPRSEKSAPPPREEKHPPKDEKPPQ